MLLIGVFLFFGILTYLIIKRETGLILRIYEEHSSITANAIYEHLKEHMLDNNPAALNQHLNELNINPVLKVSILSADGSPAFNSKFTVPQKIFIDQKEISVRTGDELTYYKPLRNDKGCHKCHSPLDSTRGMIIIRHTLGLEDEIEGTVGRILIFALFLGLTSEIFLIVVLRKFIINPIHALAAGAERLSKGELDHRVSIKSNDEIGILSDAFNQMAGRIETSHIHLENAVRQRTNELRVIAEMSLKTFRGDFTLKRIIEQFLNAITDEMGYDYSAVCLVDKETGLLLQEFKKGITNGFCALEIPLASEHPLARTLRLARLTIKKAEEIGVPQAYGTIVIVPIISHQRKRCRDVNLCTHENCPAFNSADERCWLIDGTLCRSPQAIAGKEKIYGCLHCNAFPLLGILIAGRKENEITKTSLHSLEILASQAASTIENHRFIEAKKGDIINLIRLHDISVEKLQNLDTNTLKNLITASIMSFANVDSAILYLTRPDGKFYLESASDSIDKSLIPKSFFINDLITTVPLDSSIVEDRVIETTDFSNAPGLSDLTKRHGFLYMALIPLKLENSLKGIVLLFKKKDFYMSDSEKAILSLFVSQSVAAMNTAEIYQQLKIQKEFSDAVFNNMSMGIMVIDKEGIVIRLNQAGFEILKINDYIIGRNLLNVIPEAYPFLSIEVAPKLGQEIELQTGANTIPIGFSNSQLFDTKGEYAGTVVVFRDLIEIRRLQTEISKKHRFETMGKVIAGVAHEIRNPLFGISSLVQILEREVKSPEQSAILQAISKEALRMKNLIEELLLYSRPSRLNIIDIDLSIFMEKMLSYTKAKKEEITLSTMIPASLEVRADMDKLTQVFLNLMDNAINAGCKNIDISAKKEGGEAVITIRDDGDGIKKELQDKIFDPFFTTRKDGTGLGLGICKKLIEEHNGTIEIESKEGLGTVVMLTLKTE